MKKAIFKTRTRFYLMARRWSAFTRGQKKTAILASGVIGPLFLIAFYAGQWPFGVEIFMSAKTAWLIQSTIALTFFCALEATSKHPRINRGAQ